METTERNRLTQMVTLLRFLKLRGRSYVNIQTLADHMHIPQETIYKLLTDIGLGIPADYAFEIGQGMDLLENILGHRTLSEAFIAGAGKMGSRLIRDEEFRSCGLKITAAFDIDPAIIGTEINGVKIVSIEKITSLAHRMHIALGIITTPPDQAQQTADRMVEAKIQVIWNFTPASIKVPSGIMLENSSPGASLKQVFLSISERYQTLRPWILNPK